VKHPEQLDRYLEIVARASVGVTALGDPVAARRVLVDDALTAAAIVTSRGPASMVDVGSGGGSPGIPLAIETGVPVALLESRERKCDFLRTALVELVLPGTVIHGRSEDAARGPHRDAFELATARALAPPPVAVELCLPLVAPGGLLILWTAEVPVDPLRAVAAELGGSVSAVTEVGRGRRLICVAKHEPTPPRFPRRPGVAAKRPLA
jgi:16S rRNA (guanine527-N7)-methyltransferase